MKRMMIEPRLFERLTRKKEALDALRPLPAAALAKLTEQLDIEWTYHSNAIEGNTLTLRETQLILERGLTIGGKSLREHFEVINHRGAIRYVEALAGGDEPLTPFHVRQLHALVMARIDDAEAGRYRSLPVRIAGTSFEPPDALDVPPRMDEWAAWLHGEGAAEHPVVCAAVAHHRLVAIHPFLDGNGRTGRLLMNLVLMQEGYPPTVIQHTARPQYYRALARADRGDDRPLANFVARAVERSLTLYLDALTPRERAPSADNQWISLREAAEGTPYGQEYLSLLARTGRLEAMKRGRNWHTTRAAIARYRSSVQPDS